jgi:long-chain acyl-CoA synthetase
MMQDDQEHMEALAAVMEDAAEVGMQPAIWAELTPDRVAVYDCTLQNRSFGELNANANRIARLLRAVGLQPSDSVALACSNRAEFCDVLLAVLRTGMRCTPVNWHLTGDEIAYIVNDCEARALFADSRIAEAVAIAAPQCSDLALKVAIGGEIAGFSPFDAAMAPFDGSNIDDPMRGHTMLYTSGTTGRPKGVHKPGAVYAPFNRDADRDNDIYPTTRLRSPVT